MLKKYCVMSQRNDGCPMRKALGKADPARSLISDCQATELPENTLPVTGYILDKE